MKDVSGRFWAAFAGGCALRLMDAFWPPPAILPWEVYAVGWLGCAIALLIIDRPYR
jgi:hypothetical protein